MDSEKVIKGLENCKEGGSCDGCEYDIQSSRCIFRLHADALALLKEYDTQVQYRDDHIAEYEKEIKRLNKLVKEQEAEIRQLRLALDIAKGTCKGIVVETDEKFMGDL